MPSNSFEMTVAKFHSSSVILRRVSIHETTLESLNSANSVDLQLLVKTASDKAASDEAASDDVALQDL
jgi:hypothetical protein